jgi:hypothetical protein
MTIALISKTEDHQFASPGCRVLGLCLCYAVVEILFYSNFVYLRKMYDKIFKFKILIAFE